MKNNEIMAVAAGAQLTSALTEKLKSKTTEIKSSSKCYSHFIDIQMSETRNRRFCALIKCKSCVRYILEIFVESVSLHVHFFNVVAL